MRDNLRRCLAAALTIALLLCAFCVAEEEAQSEEFVQLEPGMEGEEIENLNARLTVLGYLDEALGAEYDEGTEEAVKAFQAVAELEVTGVADVETQRALMAEDAPVNPDNPPAGEMVWISQTGEKYHSNWNCGNMKGPSCVAKEEAIEMGREPCSRCYAE